MKNFSYLFYDRYQTMVWREERSRIKVVEKDSFRDLLDIGRIDGILNAEIRVV